MLIFNFREKVFVRALMAVLVKRNGRPYVFLQEEWSPDKNPYETLRVKNQVLLRRSFQHKDVEVAVSDKFGLLKPWDICDGSIVFRTYGRIMVDIIDHEVGEKQSLLVCYERDKKGTFRATITEGPVVQLDPKEQPLTAKLELPKKLEPEPDIAGEQCDHGAAKNGGKMRHVKDDKPKGRRRNAEPKDDIRAYLGLPSSELADL